MLKFCACQDNLAVMACANNFFAIWSQASELQQNKMYIEFKLRMKNHQWNGPLDLMRRQHAKDSSDINMAAIDSESRPAAKGQLISTNQMPDISQWDTELILLCIADLQVGDVIRNREGQITAVEYMDLIDDLGKRSNKSVCRTVMSVYCDSWRFDPWAHFNNNFSFIFKFDEICVLLLSKFSLNNFDKLLHMICRKICFNIMNRNRVTVN